MKRFIFLFFTLVCFAFAKADYAQMSNEELIALIGYVSVENKDEFHKELKKRQATFSKKEQKLYEENLQNLKTK